ncbi:DUF6049 family protein [Isoptericola sp. BMS4]|uniref:DUF6049 family protein n=1 Tax=Isoptericola sp. BMS4 TaxID=2527875 RepID=UPI001422AFB4|nr:DUF6049 family protein [Isoptericola sp. BMS4]
MTSSRSVGVLAALVTFFAGLVAVLLVAGLARPTPGPGDTAARDDVTTGLPASATAAPGAAPAAVDGEVTVELVSSQPAVARPGGTVTLTVRVTNGRETALEGSRLDLGVHWRPVTSRDDLAAWSGSTSTTTASRQLVEDVGKVPAGDTVERDLELDVDILDLAEDAPWGPREMSVSVVDQAESTLDVLHTFLLYAPEGSAPDPVGISVVAPVTGPAVPVTPDGTEEAGDTDGASTAGTTDTTDGTGDEPATTGYADELASLTADGGRLSALADAATPDGDAPGITLAADPALVSAAQASDDAASAAWAARLVDGSVPEVAALPAFDPDLGALAHADVSSADVRAATNAVGTLGDTWRTPASWDLTLAWPQGRPDVATLGAARDARVDHVVVGDGLAPRGDAPATARTAVATPGGKVSALVADDHLSDVVASLTTDDSAPTPGEAAQRLLADAAVLAVEQADATGGGDPLRLLAAVPRGWTPDVDAVHQVLAALDQAGWSDVVPLAETIDTPATDTPRDDLPGAEPDGAELKPASVRALSDARRSVAGFATVADDPAALTAPVGQDLVAPLAVAYRDARDMRSEAVSTAVAQASALRQGISVVERTTVTLISDNGQLPVLVRNDLPTDATVTVVLRPDDPRLKIETRPTVVVPAGRSADVPVQVRAIGSGNVTITVEALAPSGATAAAPTTFDVRVRAGWETVGTAVIAAAIGVLFIAGIWRSVRRARRRGRPTAGDSADAGSTAAEAAPPVDAATAADGAPPGVDRPAEAPRPVHQPPEDDRA